MRHEATSRCVGRIMIKHVAYIALLLLSFGVSAADINWYRVAANTTLTIDWLQTREISRNDDFYETNRILGEQPSSSDVDKYFAASILLTNIIGEILPGKYGDYFYLTVAIIETKVVAKNYTLGIRIKF